VLLDRFGALAQPDSMMEDAMSRLNVPLVCRLVACCLAGVCLLMAAPIAAVAQDADGDGIVDQLDPDDDNDGIFDVDEGTDAGPQPQEPPDADDDGIVDQLDPDDDNDAVTDADEPVPAPGTGQPSTGGGSGSSSGDDSSPPSGNGVMISALPVTGSGTGRTGDPVPLLSLAIPGTIAIIAGGCFVLRRWRST